ncbi:hypothetical protein GCM10027048_15410 [Hymenobacter coalescens]
MGLALGMPAAEIEDLYLTEAKNIFGTPRRGIKKVFYSLNDNLALETILREKFSKYSPHGDTRLGHAKTRVCIPAFNAPKGEVNVYKTCHHERFKLNYHVPAYQVCMSSAAAPIYFDPYTIKYQTFDSHHKVEIKNNVDGGIFANNPSLIGLTEAHRFMNIAWNDIKLLSIGTGQLPYKETRDIKAWGAYYWVRKKRILEAMFQAQSEMIHNTVQVLSHNIHDTGTPLFKYERIQFQMEQNEAIRLDETSVKKLDTICQKATRSFQERSPYVMNDFFSTEAPIFQPCFPIQ